ncbi:RPM1 interacting protein 13, putative isoform 2 [Hibiscus syriacus]|uniref:RPM1 interacting protein 13, putative isoform 2 n=1 Tax=Hibiscus syriacus TaxID=106335 RepID=A0A6A2YIY7_HIBSY|nr:RPM1 interacting protein 13, putative isoform 2 [Hibiscus syriacus]
MKIPMSCLLSAKKGRSCDFECSRHLDICFQPAAAPLLWDRQYVEPSTSHEQHCELCHCFVCDMQAPCCYWGSGISSTDHCHATDKEEIWKTLRKNIRLGRNVSAPPVTSRSTVVPQQAPRRDIIRLTTQNHVSRPTPTVTSHCTVVPQRNQVPHRDNIQLNTKNHVSRPTPVQASGNCIPQDHDLMPSIIRGSSSSTRHGISYNPSVGSRHVLNKSTIQPRLGSREVLGVHNTVIRRDRYVKIRNWGSQFVPSNIMSERVDTEVTSTMNRTSYVPSENIISAHASQVDDIGQSNQPPSADYVQFQTSGSTSGEGPFNVKEGDKSYYNELESFLLDGHCPSEGYLTAGLNAPSPPDHISLDTGMLFFDIESSWDRLTRA